MKLPKDAQDSAQMAARRARYLVERPSKGDVRFHKGRRVRVQDLDDFNFTVKIETDDGVETVPFDELAENG
jgi:uncharacterized protein YqfB (UPF0267 family)